MNSVEFGSSDAASLGGKARAESLSADERKEMGRYAAQIRWGKSDGPIPKAIREAPLKIGNIEFECAVLNDNDDINKSTRVLSERAFARAIGSKRGGSHWVRRRQNPAGAKLPVFLSANNLKAFISMELAAALSEPTQYIMESGQHANGIRAELIPQILDVWLKARDSNRLSDRQKPFAKVAEILMRGLAATGIVALIDEATGIQDIRAKDALATFLEAYVAKEWRTYMRTFPLNFYRELCRLRNVPFREDMKMAPYWGHLINDLIWDRLTPGLKDELRILNPVLESGRRKYRHHQRLTENLGHPKLLHHLGILEGIAMGCKDGEWDEFYAKANIALPSFRNVPLLAYARHQKDRD